jgi:hypothetical protein
VRIYNYVMFETKREWNIIIFVSLVIINFEMQRVKAIATLK